MTEQPQQQPQPQLPSAASAVYQPQPMLEADARMWAMLINLVCIAGIVLSGGLLSVVGVLVIWLVFRERSALVDFHGKQQVNVMLTGVLVAIVVTIGSIITLGIGAFVLIPAALAYGVYIFVITILAAVAANRGEYYRIPAIVRFIK